MNSGLNLRKLPCLPYPQSDSVTIARSLAPTDAINGVSPKQGQLITRILGPALSLWLRSQLDSIENLQITLTGGNRQILSGSIPSVLISASHAIYQGIHLSEISLQGLGIRFNISEVIKGKPLYLIDPVPIDAKLNLSQANVNASLKAPLFVQAVQEFLDSWLHPVTNSWDNLQIHLGQDRLTVTGVCQLVKQTENTSPRSAVLQMGIEIRNGHQLYLLNPQLQIEGEDTNHLDNFSWDLGSEVIISELTLIPGQLTCQGQIRVTS